MEWWYITVEYMKKAVYVPSTQLNAGYEILLDIISHGKAESVADWVDWLFDMTPWEKSERFLFACCYFFIFRVEKTWDKTKK